jgi:hypothetical protein
LAEHLRAILRDVLCGHLPEDLRGTADELLTGEAAVTGSARLGDEAAPYSVLSGAGSVCPPGIHT